MAGDDQQIARVVVPVAGGEERADYTLSGALREACHAPRLREASACITLNIRREGGSVISNDSDDGVCDDSLVGWLGCQSQGTRSWNMRSWVTRNPPWRRMMLAACLIATYPPHMLGRRRWMSFGCLIITIDYLG